MKKRKVRFECGMWRVFEDGELVGDIQKWKYWRVTINGTYRDFDTFADARNCAYWL